jgi:hypothetical protein
MPTNNVVWILASIFLVACSGNRIIIDKFSFAKLEFSSDCIDIKIKALNYGYMSLYVVSEDVGKNFTDVTQEDILFDNDLLNRICTSVAECNTKLTGLDENDNYTLFVLNKNFWSQGVYEYDFDTSCEDSDDSSDKELAIILSVILGTLLCLYICCCLTLIIILGICLVKFLFPSP